MEASIDSRARALFAGIFLLGVVLRVSCLDYRPLWKDEERTAHRARADPAALIDDLGRSTHPPLYFVLVNLWGRVVGTNAPALRLFSALCGAIALAAIPWVAARFWGTRVALLAAWTVAVSPIHLHYSQEARSYALLLLLCLGSVVSVLGLLEAPSARRLAGYVTVTVAALYTHYWSFFVVLFENLLVCIAARPGITDSARILRPWILAQLLLAASLAPWLPFVAAQWSGGTGDWIASVPLDAPLKTLYRFSAGYDVDQWSPLYRRAALIPFLALYLPALVAGIWPAADEDAPARRRRLATAGYLFVPLVLALAASRVVKPMYVIGRFDLVVFPAFALLVARGLSRARPALLRAAVIGMAGSTTFYLYLRWFARPVY